MTIAKTGNKVQYDGDGGTLPFAYAFRFFDDTDLEVILLDASNVETVQVLTTDYTVSNTGTEAGGTVTMIVAPAIGEKLTILADIPETQGTDYTGNDPFPAETHEVALDRLTRLQQQTREISERSLRVNASDTALLEIPANRANTFLAFDASKNPIVTAGVTDVPVSPFMVTVLDDVDADEAVTTLGIGIVYTAAALLLASTEAARGVGEIWNVDGPDGRMSLPEAAPAATDHNEITAGGVKLYNIQAASSSVAFTQRVMNLLEDDKDCSIVVPGDSTSDEQTEWLYLTAELLGLDYLTHTVDYHLYNSGTGSYDAPVTIQTGTGSSTLDVYNASIAGSNADRLAGVDFSAAITPSGLEPDLIMISYGHNGGSAIERQITMTSIIAGVCASALPFTPIILVGQNPVTTDETMNAKVDVFRAIAADGNMGFIDIHAWFKALPNALATYYADTIHPNAIGSSVWANAAHSLFRVDKNSSSVVGRSMLNRGVVYTTDSYTGFLTNWTGVGVTLSRETTLFETRGDAIKITGDGVTSNPHFSETLVSANDIKAYQGRYFTVTFAVHVPTGSPASTGQIFLNDGVGSEISNFAGSFGGYTLHSITKKIADAATSISVDYFITTSGTSTDHVIIDRMTSADGPFVVDVAGPNQLNDISALFMSGPVWFGTNTLAATMNISAQGTALMRVNGADFYPDGNGTRDLGISGGGWRNVYANEIRMNGATVKWRTGAGSPEAFITAAIGSMYTRTDGGAGTTLYVKESGAGNTGWVAK